MYGPEGSSWSFQQFKEKKLDEIFHMSQIILTYDHENHFVVNQYRVIARLYNIVCIILYLYKILLTLSKSGYLQMR